MTMNDQPTDPRYVITYTMDSFGTDEYVRVSRLVARANSTPAPSFAEAERRLHGIIDAIQQEHPGDQAKPIDNGFTIRDHHLRIRSDRHHCAEHADGRLRHPPPSIIP